MDNKSIKYLLNQQRIAFKDNWENELDNWATDWEDSDYQDIDELKDVSDLINYLYGKIDKDSWTSAEYMYHNLLNQTREGQIDMFDDIKERTNGEL